MIQHLHHINPCAVACGILNRLSAFPLLSKLENGRLDRHPKVGWLLAYRNECLSVPADITEVLDSGVSLVFNYFTYATHFL